VGPELRDVNDADEDFLFRVFVSSRESEFSVFPEPHRAALIRMQFAAQRQSYARRYADARHSIVLVDGQDAGHLWIGEDEKDIVVLDVALLPEYRNRGIGTALYSRLIEQARAAGKVLRASVSAANPGSLRFHQRMGFTMTGGDGMYIALVFAEAAA
jgi:GNAT superfamily N-acetyltransferase